MVNEDTTEDAMRVVDKQLMELLGKLPNAELTTLVRCAREMIREGVDTAALGRHMYEVLLEEKRRRLRN